MKCPSCSSENLLCRVTISRILPLAKKGGSVKVGGHKISQIDLKNAWDKTGPGATREIRGPLFCGECDEELVYVVGASNNPYACSLEKANELGADYFIRGGEE